MNRQVTAVAIASVCNLGVIAFAFAGGPIPESARSVSPRSPAPLLFEGASDGTFEGFCEASAILRRGAGFLVADNETEDELYRFTETLEPAGTLRLSAEVEDIEALTLGPEGELIVVGSQSGNRHGEARSARELVLTQGHQPIRPDLTGCEPCMNARGLPPGEGGLSVEGAAWWDGALWFGVRSPLVDSKALLLRLAGQPTEALSVAESAPVDLGGFGVRDLALTPDGLYILAGPADARSLPHRLYRLSQPGSAPELVPVDLPAGSEGLAWDGASLIVVVDGGGKPGEPCKEAATWTRLPATSGGDGGGLTLLDGPASPM